MQAACTSARLGPEGPSRTTHHGTPAVRPAQLPLRAVAIDGAFAQAPFLWHLLLAVVTGPQAAPLPDAVSRGLRDVLACLVLGTITRLRAQTSAAPLRDYSQRFLASWWPQATHAATALPCAQALVLTLAHRGWLPWPLAAAAVAAFPCMPSRDGATLLALLWASAWPAAASVGSGRGGAVAASSALATAKRALGVIVYRNLPHLTDVRLYHDIQAL